ncbi:hypothetical protein DSL72_008232 [Monilinia vaccinii-corymbosi]|uniref:RRM domain-containing protein n=1 Tax=Monilinia vaccinii-corymbosi TaxID=61207 RepID=A0A8A3PJ79_9HELO|nr:hypothetical protein DSL72_008232 [Monilinia vaccinii-corymbosi]
MYRSILLLASTILAATVSAQQLGDGSIVPFKTGLPSCASQCGPLSDVQGACAPPAISAVSSSCFCGDSRLTPFLTGTAGVSSVCGAASCTSTTDLQSIETWYQQYCNTQSASTPASTTTSSSGSEATFSSGSSSDSGHESWFSAHVKWVVMLIILVVGITTVWLLAFYFRRRYLRKREKEIEMRPPIALGPHQLQSATGGYSSGDGAINAAEGGHHKEAARATVASTPAGATRDRENMEVASSSLNGGDSSVFDPVSQQASYTSAPSFGPSLHQQCITPHDQGRSYVPKLAISSAQNSLSSNKIQHSAADSHIELITNLKVRIAVLENDLGHAMKDKDEAIKSSVIIARALGNVANSPEKLRDSDTEELEELRVEVKRLRRENGLLWGRVESRGAGHVVAYDSSANAISRGSNTYQISGEDSDKSRSGHPIIDAAIKKIGEGDGPKRSFYPVNSNQETQLPNIVDLERLEDGSLAVPSRFSILPPNPNRRSIHDINKSNLDDILASDSEDDEEEVEIKIEDQILYQERANANFINAPTPTVLKAGFEHSPAKAIRGDDYANRGYANRNNYYARFNNRNAATGPRAFEFPPDMSESTSNWTSPQQRDDEINTHMRASDPRDFKFPDYFRYGLIYVPKEGDRDTLRGVHIGGLPKDVDLRDVLARVRGGRIYASVLLNTMSISGSNSALVTFINQADAEAYVQYANAHPIAFDSSDSDEEHIAKAIVTRINTPTFPFSPGRLKAIFELNHTRILTVRNFPQHVSLRRLEADLSGRTGIRAERILEWYVDEDGTLRMEFSSIDAAGSAFGILSNMNGYRELRLELQFAKDHCEGGLEELEKEAEKRKPMLPRIPLGNAEAANADFNMQRERLTALQKKHDAIPSLRGEGLKSSSWADEVIGESGENTSNEAPKKDEDASITPVTPQRAPRIVTGKQWLQELAAKVSSPSASTSTPTFPTPPAPTPSTPHSNEATPRPRLTLSTTSFPPKTMRKSPEPSSAEYSLHSFASSAVSAGDDSPAFSPPQEQIQVHDPTHVQAATRDAASASAPPQPSSIPPIPSLVSGDTIKALTTFKNTITDADTNVYFVPGADPDTAILDSDVGSPKGGSGSDRGYEEMLEKERLATKMNPDEIDLDLGLDPETGTEGDGKEGRIDCFQKELRIE